MKTDATLQPSSHPGVLKKATGDKLFSIALLLPSVLVTAVFILIPVINSVVESFQDYKVRNIISGEPGTWNNFRNYIKLNESGQIWSSVAITLEFVAIVVILQFVFAMVLAATLNSRIKGARFFRSIIMIPWVIPTVISALIWMWIFQPQYGLLKYLGMVLSAGRVTDLAPLNNPHVALFGIAVAALWKGIPLTAVLLLAGMQNVSEDMLEAATVDGAGRRTKFFKIVLPSIMSVINVTVLMAIIDNFKQFPLFWVMTGGGPNNSTTTLAVLSYEQAFVSNNLGSGAAVTTIWLLLMCIVVLIYNRVMRAQFFE